MEGKMRVNDFTSLCKEDVIYFRKKRYTLYGVKYEMVFLDSLDYFKYEIKEIILLPIGRIALTVERIES